MTAASQAAVEQAAGLAVDALLLAESGTRAGVADAFLRGVRSAYASELESICERAGRAAGGELARQWVGPVAMKACERASAAGVAATQHEVGVLLIGAVMVAGSLVEQLAAVTGESVPALLQAAVERKAD